MLSIAQELSLEEHKVQMGARELLFDVLAGGPFSKERPELMPLLFLHWKDKLIDNLSALLGQNAFSLFPVADIQGVRSAESWESLPRWERQVVSRAIDSLVLDVHPELKSIWKKSNRREFQKIYC